MKWNYDNYQKFLHKEKNRIVDSDSMDNVIEHAVTLLSETSGLGNFLRKNDPTVSAVNALVRDLNHAR